MAWHHVEDSTVTAPKVGRRHLGGTVEKTFSIWRCGNCRALAVGSEGEKPHGPCLKCKAPG